jgi:chorismate synthase
MSIYGQALPVSFFGESHGPLIGLTIHNMPAGIHLDTKFIESELTKRRPKSSLSTARREPDPFEIVSGYFNNQTTGMPLTIIIKNTDTRSKDYTPNLLRPSTSDFVAHVKYNGANDYRGSGHFSGRLTALTVILGAISQQLLKELGVTVGSHILQISSIKDSEFDYMVNEELLNSLNACDFPVLNQDVQSKMEDVILSAKNQQDSVGGMIETCILGMPVGVGNPLFEKATSIISHLITSIPAVKGILFGAGMDFVTKKGSEMNDAIEINDGRFKTKTNHSGGIQGGITNGMPIVFKTIVKPTASIAQNQDTVDTNSNKNSTTQIKGRHDPAIVHRAVHVVNAMSAYACLELLLKERSYHDIKRTKKSN